MVRDLVSWVRSMEAGSAWKEKAAMVTAQWKKMGSVEWHREGLAAEEGRPVWWPWLVFDAL